jgi:hypothetical protein
MQRTCYAQQLAIRVDFTEVMHEVHRQIEHGEAKGKQDEEPSESPAAWDESAFRQATCIHVDDPQSLPVMRASPRTLLPARETSLHKDAPRQ